MNQFDGSAVAVEPMQYHRFDLDTLRSVAPVVTVGFADKPVFGFDYLIDYYAVLGVRPTASAAAIGAAYYEKVKNEYFDVVVRTVEELKGIADAHSILFNEAYDVLRDEKHRKIYHAHLMAFDPRLVSASGRSLENPDARKIRLKDLMNSYEPVRLEEMEEQVLRFSGYIPSLFTTLEDQITELKKNQHSPSRTLSQSYQEMLWAKFVYDQQMEQIAWNAAGIANQMSPTKVLHALDYLEQRKTQIEEVKSEIRRGVNLQLRSLATGGCGTLSLTVGRVELKPAEIALILEDLTERITRRALGNFESHQNNLQDLAQVTAEDITKLLFPTK